MQDNARQEKFRKPKRAKQAVQKNIADLVAAGVLDPAEAEKRLSRLIILICPEAQDS